MHVSHRWVLTDRGLDVLAHIRLRESWSKAAVANVGESSSLLGRLGDGERQPYSKVQEG